MNPIIYFIGTTIQVPQYKIDYQTLEQPIISDNGTIADIYRDKTLYFDSLESAKECSLGEPIKLDTESYQWMNGIDIGEGKEHYKEAMRIYEMGEEAYKKSLLQANAQTNEQLYSDVSQCILSMIS